MNIRIHLHGLSLGFCMVCERKNCLNFDSYANYYGLSKSGMLPQKLYGNRYVSNGAKD